MTTFPFFTNHLIFDFSWEDGLALILALALIGLAFRLRGLSTTRPSTGYASRLAWHRAGIYFCACFLVSWGTGVMKTLTGAPWATTETLRDPRWLGFTALCLGVVIVGYAVIWPQGTLAHGRARHLPTVIIFGGLWGLSEGQLFLSFWAIPEKFGLSALWTGVIAFLVTSTFLGLWHALYWDIQVAPEHNIAEWNGKKVLFAHIPNLLCCLTYLAWTGSAGMFVLFQTVALVSSTYFMRFPSYVVRGTY